MLVSAGLFLLACDRNTEAYVEGETPRAPDLARIFPESEGAGGPGGAPGMGAPQRGNVPARPSPALPAQRGAPPVAAQPVSASDTITGTIRLGEGMAGSRGMLFVIARPFGVTAGPPLAVLRVPSPSFPLDFEIGPANVMIPSMRFEGDIGISARLDGDGNAMTRNPGDLQGATTAPLQPGAREVEIVLDQKL